MPIKSFLYPLVIKPEDLIKFIGIMSDDKKIQIAKVDNHKIVMSKDEIKKLLNL